MIPVASVHNDVFYKWSQKFVEETTHIRKNGKRLMLVCDGYGSHVRYKTLKVVKNNGMICVGLLAQTSRAFQPINFSVFRAFKEDFKKQLGNKVITLNGTNEIFLLSVHS